jgi:transcription termination factor Rho
MMTEEKAADSAPAAPESRGPRPQPPPPPQKGRPVSPVPTIDPAVPAVDLSRLKHVKVPELHAQAIAAGVDVSGNLRRQDIIFEILKWQSDRNGAIQGGGVMEYNPDGYGFLREPAYNFEASADDIYVLRPAHRRHHLRPRAAADGEGALLLALQGRDHQRPARRRPQGQDPLREPDAALPRASASSSRPKASRVLDARSSTCSCPIGKGQRASSSRRRAPARPCSAGHRQRHHDEPPRGDLIVLLIDERPEEVTDMQRNGQGRGHLLHLRRAPDPPRAGRRDGVEKAKRLVEQKRTS